MPKGVDWVNLLYVNLGFISQIFVFYYFGLLADIKQNWAKYRCNPLFMPFSDNMQKDFTQCIQTNQINFMGSILEPIHYMLSILTSSAGKTGSIIQDIRSVIFNVRTFLEEIAKKIFGVLLNVLVEFQKIIVNIENLVGRLMGIMLTLVYLLDGSVKTMQSTWNGPPGELTRDLCFHPETKIKLIDGRIVCMKDVNLGDIIENGSRITVVMKIENIDKQEYYVIPSKGVNNEHIFLTANHLIFDKNTNKFIKTKDHPDAKTLKEMGLNNMEKSEWFSCLITSDHNIKIGECLFWDWEDDLLKE